MKKLILIAGLLLNALSFSQVINVDTSTYTPYQLANDKLVHATCANGITNFTSKQGSDYGLPASIGYFTNTNPNFPISSGVVLSTGSVANATGPNNTIQSIGNVAAWTGDTSLENVMTAAGYSMTSTNATYMQFDFVPIASTFGFNFVFSSEEYGAGQCSFSDSFAFILTDLTVAGAPQNLAVIPSTTIPISVSTIRDYTYNTNCASSYANWFGSYNGAANAAASSTNFEGQTKLMSASATLIPGHTYQIKLVIADNNDYQNDSAIFIDSQNFNTGTQIIPTTLSICDPSQQAISPTQIIPTVTPLTDYIFEWRDNLGNLLTGSNVTGTNGSTLNVSTSGTYTLTYQQIGNLCPYPTNSVVVSYYPTFTAGNPKNVYTCQSSSPFRYDLSINTNTLLNGLSGGIVTYHATLSDAQNNTSALSNPYTFSGTSGTVYARITDTYGCYQIKNVPISQIAAPTSASNATISGVNAPCQNNNGATPPNATFNLNTVNNAILNGLSANTYSLTYYTSPTLSASSQILTPNSFVAADNTIIYASINIKGDPDTDCSVVRTVTLNFKPLAPVDTLTNVIACTQYTLQPLTNGFYNTSSNGTGTTYNAGDVITTTTPLYVVNLGDGVTNCPNKSPFNLTIINTPTFPTDFAGIHCAPYHLPTAPSGSKFYLNSTFTGTSYFPGATLPVGVYDLYWYYPSTATNVNCPLSAGPFHVEVKNAPTAQANIYDCVSYTLPALASGLSYHSAANGGGTSYIAGDIITTAGTNPIYIYNGNCDINFNVIIGNLSIPNNQTQCAGVFSLPALSIGTYHEGSLTGPVVPSGTVVNQTTTFYVELPSRTGANYSCINNFTITVPTPVLPTISNFLNNCETFTSVGNLPTLPSGVNYYDGTHASGNIPTQLIPPFTITNTTNVDMSLTYYTYAIDSVTGCWEEKPFTIVIHPKPLVSSLPPATVACNTGASTDNTYFLPANNTNEIYSTADHTTSGTTIPSGNYYVAPGTSSTIYIVSTDPVTGCKNSSSFVITNDNVSLGSILPTNHIFESCDTFSFGTDFPLNTGVQIFQLPGGPTAAGQVQYFSNTVFTSSQSVYLYLSNNTRLDCPADQQYTINIYTTPTAQMAPANPTGCGSYTLPALTAGNYYYDGTHASGATPNQITNLTLTVSQTVWIYNPNPAHPACFDENSFSVVINAVPTVATANQIASQSACDTFTLPAFTGANHHYYDSTGTEVAPLTIINTLGANNFTIKNIDPTTTCESTPYAFTITLYRSPQATDWTAGSSACGSLAYTLPAGYTLYNGTHAGGASPSVVTSPITASGTYYIANNAYPVCEFPITITINTTATVDPSRTITGCSDTGVALPAFTNANNHYFDSFGVEWFPGNMVYTSQVFDIRAYDTNCTNATINQLTVNITTAPTTAIWTAGNYGCGNLPFTLPTGYVLLNSSNTAVSSPITASGNYYIADSTLNSCKSSAIAITIEAYPTLDSSVTSLPSICSGAYPSGYTLPALAANNEYYLNGTTLWNQSTPVPVNVSSYNFVIKAVSSTGCANPTTRSLTLTIYQTPSVPTQTPVYACDSYSLPNLPTGYAYYDGSHSGSTTPNVIAVGTVIAQTQTIYVYAETSTTPNCWDEETLTINVYNVFEPTIAATVCSGYTLPTLTNGNYYWNYNTTTQTASNPLTSNTLTATTSTPMTIYVWGQSGFSPNCSDVYTINVTVEPSAKAYVTTIPTSALTFCDDDTNTTNGYTINNLATLYNSYILGTQTGSNFSVAYYLTPTDALNQTNAVTSTSQTFVYVRVNNTAAPASCAFDIQLMNFTINPLPNPQLGMPVICMNADGTVQNPATVTASLPTGNYSYTWTVPTGVTNPGNVASFTTTVTGFYKVDVINNTTGCTMSAPASVTVIQSVEPTVTYTASADFADTATITITASPVGNYLYQIDGGSYQSSPVFTDVESGHHTVIVKDLYGCNPSSPVDVYIVNYPHFFTPNGDGNNDYWNIKDLRHFGIFSIRIFDRYGKLIKEISTNTPGWDGLYNNEMLPADDYWFTIEYFKDNVKKEFKSHFALIR